MEPHAVIADFKGDSLTVWAGAQTPTAVQKVLSRLFGLQLAKVRVIVPFVGGGFGGKASVKIEPLVAAASWKVQRPVRVAQSISDSMLTCRRLGRRDHDSHGRGRKGANPRQERQTATRWRSLFRHGLGCRYQISQSHHRPLRGAEPAPRGLGRLHQYRSRRGLPLNRRAAGCLGQRIPYGQCRCGHRHGSGRVPVEEPRGPRRAHAARSACARYGHE